MRNGELDRQKAARVLELLIRNIAQIRYVADWAEAACVSPEWLRKKMNLIYGKAPNMIIREVRYKVIISLIIEEGIDVTSIVVAIESGVGSTSDSLYKFLKRYYGITFTELKEKVLWGKQTSRVYRSNGQHTYPVYTEYGDIHTEIDDNIHLSNNYSSFLLRGSGQVVQQK